MIHIWKEAVYILNQIINGLEYIHITCQLVHRDMKPHNVFLKKNLQVKIGDFGLVKKLNNLVNNKLHPMSKFSVDLTY